MLMYTCHTCCQSLCMRCQAVSNPCVVSGAQTQAGGHIGADLLDGVVPLQLQQRCLLLQVSFQHLHLQSTQSISGMT